MGLGTLPRIDAGPTARHRAEVPRMTRLRRDVAHLLAGRDLYADDRELRPLVHEPQPHDEALPGSCPA